MLEHAICNIGYFVWIFAMEKRMLWAFRILKYRSIYLFQLFWVVGTFCDYSLKRDAFKQMENDENKNG